MQHEPADSQIILLDYLVKLSFLIEVKLSNYLLD